MKRFIIFLVTIVLFQSSLLAGELFKWGDEQKVVRRLELKQQVKENLQKEDNSWEYNGSEKSIKKAVIFSAAVPGAGQFYSKSYIKGAFFLAVEAAAWAVNISYTKKGDDKDSEFKVYADQHWSEQAYWSYVAYRATEDLDPVDLPISRSDLIESQSPGGGTWYLIPEQLYTPELVSQLRNYEEEIPGFSHRLPETKTQQYYEMVGKYPAQFGYAWDDASFNQSYSGYTGNYTARNNFYMDMRDKANRFYNIAGYGTMAALVNHVISAIDAGFTTKRYNRAHALKVEMSYKNKRIKSEHVNMFGLNFRW